MKFSLLCWIWDILDFIFELLTHHCWCHVLHHVAYPHGHLKPFWVPAEFFFVSTIFSIYCLLLCTQISWSLRFRNKKNINFWIHSVANSCYFMYENGLNYIFRKIDLLELALLFSFFAFLKARVGNTDHDNLILPWCLPTLRNHSMALGPKWSKHNPVLNAPSTVSKGLSLLKSLCKAWHNGHLEVAEFPHKIFWT